MGTANKKLSDGSKNLLKELLETYKIYEGKEVSLIKDNGAILLGVKPGMFDKKPQEEIDFIDAIKEITTGIAAAKHGRSEHFYVSQIIRKVFDNFIKLDKNQIIRKIYIAHLTEECPTVIVSFEGRTFEIEMNSPMTAEIKLPQKGGDQKKDGQGGGGNNNNNNNGQNNQQGKKENNGGGNNNNNQNGEQKQKSENSGEKKTEEKVITLQGTPEEISKALAHLANTGQAYVVKPKS